MVPGMIPRTPPPSMLSTVTMSPYAGGVDDSGVDAPLRLSARCAAGFRVRPGAITSIESSSSKTRTATTYYNYKARGIEELRELLRSIDSDRERVLVCLLVSLAVVALCDTVCRGRWHESEYL